MTAPGGGPGASGGGPGGSGGGPGASGGPPAAPVAVVAEQLRRRVPGGIGTYCTGLLRGLAVLRAEGGAVPVSVVASRTATRPDPLAAFGFPVRAVPLPGRVLTRLWDAGLLPARHAAVVHATSLAAPPPGAGRLVVTVHDVAWRDVPDAYPPRGRRWHEAALRRARRRATHLVVPSTVVADALVADGVRTADVTVIEHGCDHLPPPDGPAADALLGRLGVTGSFVLAVGTLEPRKNLARLVAAHREAAARLPDPLPLVVVGPSGWGPEVPWAGDGAPGGPAASPVLAAGSVDAAVLAALYERALLLAYVPLVEGYGLPPLEAMRAGTAVVSSPLPSTGGASLTVDPTDVPAMADALVTLATHGDRRAALVAAGLQRAARRWRDSAAEHLAVWEHLQ